MTRSVSLSGVAGKVIDEHSPGLGDGGGITFGVVGECQLEQPFDGVHGNPALQRGKRVEQWCVPSEFGQHDVREVVYRQVVEMSDPMREVLAHPQLPDQRNPVLGSVEVDDGIDDLDPPVTGPVAKRLLESGSRLLDALV